MPSWHFILAIGHVRAPAAMEPSREAILDIYHAPGKLMTMPFDADITHVPLFTAMSDF